MYDPQVTLSGEPSPVELAAIEVEWPFIAADLAALDREIGRLSVHDLLDQVQIRRSRRVARARLRTPALLLPVHAESEEAA